VQGFAAVAAMFLRRGVGAQPMAAGLALRIDALHGPSWQVAHAASLARPWRATESSGWILRRGDCGVKNKATISSGSVPNLWKSCPILLVPSASPNDGVVPPLVV